MNERSHFEGGDLPKLISEVLGTSHARLESAGAFDGFVDVDSRLHVDPHLLSSSAAPELAGAREAFENYFRQVFSLLRASSRTGDLFWQQARLRLTFREISATGLGYAKANTKGSAIGPGLAAVLTNLAKEIVDAGVEDPGIFELVGLLQDGLGADRISDMTVAIILPHLLRFSERVAADVEAATVEADHQGAKYRLPLNRESGRALILVPQDILRHLPVANSWDDIDIVAAHNAALRHAVNPIIGETWKQATSRTSKEELRQTVLEHPGLLQDLLEQYKNKAANAYDLVADPEALRSWYYLTKSVVASEPLDLRALGPVTPENAVKVVRMICERFGQLIEDNRLSRLLYNDDGTPRKEKAAQLTFFGIADAYCAANSLDLSPEVDSGAGPIDFKFSRGYDLRINVEVKLSSNPKLPAGFSKQLAAYDRAERSLHSIYLIIRNTDADARIRAVKTLMDEASTRGSRVPDVFVVDGRPRESASKL